MKIGIVGDVHFSKYSSIVRSRGDNFSTRLEYLIKSLSWAEKVFKEHGCVEEIYLGDFFDKPDLSAEEITALSEVEWNTSSRLKHFIVGNHESCVSSLIYNSTQILHKIGVVEDTSYIYPVDENTEFLFLPYILEEDRKPLVDYLQNRNKNKKLIVFSHNDIKDFQMGPFLSTTGFKVDEIEANCDLYINGHLHNGGWVTKKILNLGNLCGQNFSEDAFKYEHHIAILDTDTMQLEFIENPYALNFYKVEVDTLDILSKLKDNAVVSIRCSNEQLDNIKQYIETNNFNIVSYKFTTYNVPVDTVEDAVIEINTLDENNHLVQFCNFMRSRDDIDLEILNYELGEVCK